MDIDEDIDEEFALTPANLKEKLTLEIFFLENRVMLKMMNNGKWSPRIVKFPPAGIKTITVDRLHSNPNVKGGVKAFEWRAFGNVRLTAVHLSFVAMSAAAADRLSAAAAGGGYYSS